MKNRAVFSRACAFVWMAFVLSMQPAAVANESGDGAAGYRAQAEEVMKYIQDNFRLRRSGLYAREAGGREPDYLWGSGVMFSALAGASRADEKWRPVMRRYFEALNSYWDAKAKVPGYEPSPTAGGGNDKYYDDNAWMVLTFLEAWEITGDSRYRKRAEETLEFVLSGWDEEAGGGIWWHEAHKDGSKNTCVNAPAAVGCFRMAKADPANAARWTGWGRKLVEWTQRTLQASNGLFSDRIIVATGRIHRGQLSYNAGLMQRAFLELSLAPDGRAWLEEANRVAAAAASLMDSGTGAYRDSLKWSHLMVEADLELHRHTRQEFLLRRAITDTAHHFAEWKRQPARDLITNASLARQLWLMAHHESAVSGRKASGR